MKVVSTMPNQDKVTRIGPVVIGQPYQKDGSPDNWERPKEALSAFLNVNASKQKEVDN